MEQLEHMAIGPPPGLLWDTEGLKEPGSGTDHHRLAKGNRPGKAVGAVRGNRENKGRVCVPVFE